MNVEAEDLSGQYLQEVGGGRGDTARKQVGLGLKSLVLEWR
jgi:hypothetical protein